MINQLLRNTLIQALFPLPISSYRGFTFHHLTFHINPLTVINIPPLLWFPSSLKKEENLSKVKVGSYSQSCPMFLDWVELFPMYILCNNISASFPGKILNHLLCTNDSLESFDPKSFTPMKNPCEVSSLSCFLLWWAKAHLVTPPPQNLSSQRTLPPGRFKPSKAYRRKLPFNSPIIKTLFHGNIPIAPMDFPWEKYLYKPVKMDSIARYPNTMPKKPTNGFQSFWEIMSSQLKNTSM